MTHSPETSMNSIRIALTHLLSRRLVAALGCALAFLAPAHASSVLPLYLEEMIDTSTTAFEGTCTANRVERDADTGFVATYTTFAVHDVIKGSVGTTRVIKQIGGSLPEDGLQYRVEGIPKFSVGESYVVFLAGVSAAGFSSPIGLEQGKFTIKAEGTARRVRNGRDFKDMTARIAADLPATTRARLQEAPGSVSEMDLDEFKLVVRGRLLGKTR